jgi:hypothetical protein
MLQLVVSMFMYGFTYLIGLYAHVKHKSVTAKLVTDCIMSEIIFPLMS